MRTPYRDRNRPAKRRYGKTIPSAVWQALRNGASRYAWWQPSRIRSCTVAAARLPQWRTACSHGHGRKPQAAKPFGLRSVALPARRSHNPRRGSSHRCARRLAAQYHGHGLPASARAYARHTGTRTAVPRAVTGRQSPADTRHGLRTVPVAGLVATARIAPGTVTASPCRSGIAAVNASSPVRVASDQALRVWRLPPRTPPPSRTHNDNQHQCRLPRQLSAEILARAAAPTRPLKAKRMRAGRTQIFRIRKSSSASPRMPERPPPASGRYRGGSRSLGKKMTPQKNYRGCISNARCGPKPQLVAESEYRHMRVSAPPFPPAAFTAPLTACVAYGRSTVQGSAAALPRGSLSYLHPDTDLANSPQRTERLRQLLAWAFLPNPPHGTPIPP